MVLVRKYLQFSYIILIPIMIVINTEIVTVIFFGHAYNERDSQYQRTVTLKYFIVLKLFFIETRSVKI